MPPDPPRPSYYVRTRDDGTVRALYRVTSGWPLRWRHFGWHEMDEAGRDRLMRQFYLGPEDIDPVPEAEVGRVQAALRAAAHRAAHAWSFGTSVPLTLRQALLRLEPLGVDWFERDSDYAHDSISACLTDHAHLRILEIGLRFRAELTIEADGARELEASGAEARTRLLDAVLPLLGAVDVVLCSPPEASS